MKYRKGCGYLLAVWTFFSVITIIFGVILKIMERDLGPLTDHYLLTVGGLGLGFSICVFLMAWLLSSIEKDQETSN